MPWPLRLAHAWAAQLIAVGTVVAGLLVTFLKGLAATKKVKEEVAV